MYISSTKHSTQYRKHVVWSIPGRSLSVPSRRASLECGWCSCSCSPSYSPLPTSAITGATAVPVAFCLSGVDLRKIQGESLSPKRPCYLAVFWLCYLVAIGRHHSQHQRRYQMNLPKSPYTVLFNFLDHMICPLYPDIVLLRQLGNQSYRCPVNQKLWNSRLLMSPVVLGHFTDVSGRATNTSSGMDSSPTPPVEEPLSDLERLRFSAGIVARLNNTYPNRGPVTARSSPPSSSVTISTDGILMTPPSSPEPPSP